VRSISNPPADACLGGGIEINVSAAAILKRFEQISDEDLNDDELRVCNCFIIIIFLFCLMKMEHILYSEWKRRKMAAEICSTRQARFI
jgi:hypothetical protein